MRQGSWDEGEGGGGELIGWGKGRVDKVGMLRAV